MRIFRWRKVYHLELLRRVHLTTELLHPHTSCRSSRANAAALVVPLPALCVDQAVWLAPR